VAGSRRFTRIPKTTELIHSGVPAEAIGTYESLCLPGVSVYLYARVLRKGRCWLMFCRCRLFVRRLK